MSETIVTKRCSKCKDFKPFSEFHKDSSRKDGCWNACKLCRSIQYRVYYYANREKEISRKKTYCQSHKKETKAYQKAYGQSERGKLIRVRYWQSENGKIAHKKGNGNYKAKFPEKIRATKKISHEIAAGRIPRPDTLKCKYCPKQAEQYHHPDYFKPLEVEPVCRKCHQNLHKSITHKMLAVNI